ncbi:MAG: DUF2889 domain-containing protein [Caulobacteraceae bacterium]|nr:DUF2889 domain-containing protein [Caulobacteraceae bacterium]
MAYAARKAPNNPGGPSPLRRPGSIRRTSTIDTGWPEGMGKPMRMRGRARDLFTSPGGAAQVLAEDSMDILSTPARQIETISTSRRNDDAQQFVGARGGGHLRGEITRLMPDEQSGTTPLNLILDDFSGASLVANWAWSRWITDWTTRMREAAAAAGAEAMGPRRMEGICSGFRPGSSALTSDGGPQRDQSFALVPPLPHPEDPAGWHEFTPQAEGVGMRRARRIDAWFDGDFVKLDIGFQDSATNPAGGPNRIAIHEYRVHALADPETFELLSIQVDPRVLPFRECPGATPNASLMVGADLTSFRLKVVEVLPGTMGCTHLNDVLRSMADATGLTRRLRAELSKLAEPA